MNQLSKRTFANYRMRDLKNGSYQIHSTNDGAFEGTVTQIFAIGLQWGLNEEDMIQAVLEMEELGHDFAEFGTMGRLIFTGKDKKEYAA